MAKEPEKNLCESRRRRSIGWHGQEKKKSLGVIYPFGCHIKHFPALSISLMFVQF
jgi:hypothetical protein